MRMSAGPTTFGTSTSSLLSTLALGLRSIVSAPWTSQLEDMPKVLKRPRLSAGISESVEDMNQTRLEQGGIQDVISMHPHSSSEAPKEKELALRDDHRRCDSGSDFDREKDQGQARAPGSEDSTEVLVTPRASVQSPEAAHEIETDQAGSLSDPPLHLKLLEACVGSFTMQNVRPYQEDRTAFMVLGNAIHIGLFDGHAGGTTSTYLQENLLSAIYEQGLSGVYGPEALQRSFLDTNNDLRKMRSAYSCGSTATTVILDGDSILCANAGDSPAFVVSRSGEAFSLTVDHNPNTNAGEKLRVEAAGGRIEKMNWGERNKRVLSYDSLSGLAMTRAFGDFNFPGVICDPHITETRLGLDAQYLVVASDGLTEQWSISGAAQAVCDLARLGHSPSNIASMISNKAMEKGSRDNITVVVLDLDAYAMSCRTSAGGSSDDISVDDDDDQRLPPDGRVGGDGLERASSEEPISGPDMVTVASLMM